MTVSPSTLDFYMKHAELGVPIRTRAEREERIEAGKPHVYGGDAMVAGLRCFVRYHKDARSDVELAGRMRSLTHKQVAMSGLLARVAVTGEHATITALAKEANVVPSTLSRFLDKLQCWNVYAINVTRGRNGGITVRLRAIGDQLAAYAERAWSRIRKAAEKALSRTRLNVASSIQGREMSTSTTTTVMDATFTEVGRGCLVFGCDEDHGAPLALSFTAREAAETRARAEAWATDVLRERARLAIEDPWGELDAEYPIGWARELRHGVG